MRTMEPGPPWACMAAAPCFTQITEPVRLRSMVPRTAATSAVSTEPRCSEPPAQAKRPSMRPVASAAGPAAGPRRGDAPGRVDELLLGAPADRHVRALRGELLRRGEPDAAAAAGDEDG